MRTGGWLAGAILAVLVVTLVVLGVTVFQLNTIEERFVLQSRQLRELGESTDRLRGEVGRLVRSGGLVTDAGPRSRTPEAETVTLLHPEVENLLETSDFSYARPGVPQDGRLSRPMASGDPKGFNIIKENAADLSSLLANYVTSSLAGRMAWTDPDRWQGDAAWRVEITDDFKEFTIYLRHGLLWQRPNVNLDDERYAWLRGEHELTAHDVVFTLDMMMNPQVENGFLKNYYADLESWKAVDDYTLVIRWKRKLYGNIESTLGITPIPEFIYAYEENGERIPDETLGLKFNQHWFNNKGLVGTGPYRFDHYEPGAFIRLVRNEDYWGDKPAIREIVYPIFTDPNKEFLMLKSGEIQFGGLSASKYRDEILRWADVPPAEQPADNPFLNGTIECQKSLRFAYSYIGWNGDKPIFQDKRVRRAMTHALDRQRLIENVWVGLGSIATGPFYKLSPYRDGTIVPLAFDLDRARELLAEAGWQDSDGDGLVDKDLDGDGRRDPFEFTLLIYGQSPEYASLANIYKEDLLEIGVRMKIDSAEWSLMQKKMDDKEFDAFTGGWLLPWEGDPYQLWYSSQADVPKGSNKVGFRNAEADEIILALRETFDHEERVRLFHRFHRIIHEEQPYTFFRYPETVACWRRDLQGVIFAKVRPQANSLPWWIATPD